MDETNVNNIICNNNDSDAAFFSAIFWAEDLAMAATPILCHQLELSFTAFHILPINEAQNLQLASPLQKLTPYQTKRLSHGGVSGQSGI